jgi:hypothetical protein
MLPGSPVPRAKITVMSVQQVPPLTPFSELPPVFPAQLAPLFLLLPALLPAEPVLVGAAPLATGVGVAVTWTFEEPPRPPPKLGMLPPPSPPRPPPSRPPRPPEEDPAPPVEEGIKPDRPPLGIKPERPPEPEDDPPGISPERPPERPPAPLEDPLPPSPGIKPDSPPESPPEPEDDPLPPRPGIRPERPPEPEDELLPPRPGIEGRPDGKLNCGWGRALAAPARATIDAVEYFMSRDRNGQRCKAKVKCVDEQKMC